MPGRILSARIQKFPVDFIYEVNCIEKVKIFSFRTGPQSSTRPSGCAKDFGRAKRHFRRAGKFF